MSENRKHIHVEAKKGRFRKSAKFWLEPDNEMVEPGDFTNIELNFIKKVILENRMAIINQIENFLSGKKIKIITL